MSTRSPPRSLLTRCVLDLGKLLGQCHNEHLTRCQQPRVACCQVVRGVVCRVEPVGNKLLGYGHAFCVGHVPCSALPTMILIVLIRWVLLHPLFLAVDQF